MQSVRQQVERVPILPRRPQLHTSGVGHWAARLYQSKAWVAKVILGGVFIAFALVSIEV